MIDTSLWVSFVATVFILVITPGPSVLLAAANSMKYGSKKATGTIFGDLSANIIQIILASTGLATIINNSGEVFQWIKWIGVGYLLYMGLKKVIATPIIEFNKSKKIDKSYFKLYTEGFLMSAANPKAIVFFAVLFPLFINQSLPFLPQILILGITFILLDGASLFFYTHFASKLKSYLENKEKIHFQNRIVGSLLIVSAILLSLVKRTTN